MINKVFSNDGAPYFEMRCAYKAGLISTEVKFSKALESESIEDQEATREALAADAVCRLARELNISVDAFIVRLRAVDEIFRKHYERQKHNLN